MHKRTLPIFVIFLQGGFKGAGGTAGHNAPYPNPEGGVSTKGIAAGVAYTLQVCK